MGSRWLTVALVATLLLAACNGGGADAPAEPTTTAEPADAQPRPTAEEVTLPLRLGQPALYVVDADGSGLRKLFAEGDSIDTEAGWSPDGGRLLVSRAVCVQCGGGGSKPVLAAADGSGEVSLSGAEGFQGVGSSSSWSPDGARIVYSGDALYVADADGSNARAIVDLPGSAYRSATWSPDGDQIFFVREAAETVTYAVRSDGSDLEVLGADVTLVAPDGETMAELTEDGVIIRRPGEEDVVVNQGVFSQGVFNTNATWSPDSTRLAFAQGDGSLWVVDVNGDLRRLATPDRFGGFRWSPDGSQIAYLASGAVWVIDAAGGEPRRLAEEDVHGSIGTQPALVAGWQPNRCRGGSGDQTSDCVCRYGRGGADVQCVPARAGLVAGWRDARVRQLRLRVRRTCRRRVRSG